AAYMLLTTLPTQFAPYPIGKGSFFNPQVTRSRDALQLLHNGRNGHRPAGMLSRPAAMGDYRQLRKLAMRVQADKMTSLHRGLLALDVLEFEPLPVYPTITKDAPTS